jgi:DNA-binding response OmpR family regulator
MLSDNVPIDTRPLARILIIEDEPLLALDLEDTLINAGFAVSGTARTLAMALALIESVNCDAAIVDANLGGVSASPAASALSVLGVPYIVFSGYSPEQHRGPFPDAHFIQKPCRPAQLIQALNSIVIRR